MQRASWIGALALVVSGCQAAPALTAARAAASGPQATPTPVAPVASGLLLRVRGPADLVRAGGAVVTDDSLVAAGAGNLVAAGAGNLTVAADGVLSHNGGALVAAVGGARCHLEALDGARLGPAVASDVLGDARFPAMAALDSPTVAVAHFTTAGQGYRVTALVPAGAPGGPLVVDPISTMIVAVAREAARRHPGAEVLGQASLARIRAICEGHGLSADADDLVYPETEHSSLEGLRGYWIEEVEEHVADAGDRAALDAFTRTLGELGTGDRSPRARAFQAQLPR